MKILVLGGGGREHAIVATLAKSPKCDMIYAAPGNGGTAHVAMNIDLDICSGEAVVAFAKSHGIELVVIGPEAPLVAGVADAVRGAGIACFGPGAAGARIEGSKSFAKSLMDKYDLPTAAYGTFTDKKSALAYLKSHPAPIVIKADGLAGGKGVVIAMKDATAQAAVEECFDGRFGAAGQTVVIEEMLQGPECSLLAFVDGQTVLPMAPAQDHKRAFDGDIGPNTGGMGVYSPVPIVRDEEYDAMVDIMCRCVAGMRAEGIDYRGCLYGGFMLTDEGPKLLEFNARFGDPETQVVLPRLETDLVEVMVACANGNLKDIELSWSSDWAVSVVLTSEGYPGKYNTGLPIHAIGEAEAIPGVTVYHAGTALDDDGQLVTSGGRVLDVTALAPDFADARNLAYTAASLIKYDGRFFRSDIGARALRGRAAWD